MSEVIPGLLIGTHCSKVSKVDGKDVDIGASIRTECDYFDLNSAQIFVANPHTGVVSDIDVGDVVEKTSDIDLSVHSAYVTVSIWKGCAGKPLNTFLSQLGMCHKIRASPLVIHLPKKGVGVVAPIVRDMLPYAKKFGVKIGLEMPAYRSGDSTYDTPDKLRSLCEAVGPSDYYGIVVDTAHLHGAGIDVSSYDAVKAWLDAVPVGVICLFHLNGSYAARGSGKDKHAIPFSSSDVIWHGVEPYSSGVRAVVEYGVRYRVPIVLEVNRGSNKELDSALVVIKGLALGKPSG